MASEVTIPRLGWNMEEGTFIGWLKKDGDRVAAGEPLFSLEGDKATQEIESLETGILRIPPDGPHEGEKIAVGRLIGYVLEPDERAPFATNSTTTLNQAVRPDAPPGRAAAPDPGATKGEPEPAPAHVQPRQPGAKLRVSPRARRVASELGIDAASVVGSGINGRIVECDIRAAAGATARTPAVPSSAPASEPAWRPAPPSTAPAALAGEEAIAVTSIRRTIAERMVQSARTTAAVTLSTTVDATNLVNLRQQFKAVGITGEAPSITFTDLIVKLTALALEKHPLLNARWSGDKIMTSSTIHIGVAVDTDAGLVVPVIRDVGRQTLRQLAAASRDLIDRARRGTLTAGDMQGGTFTVTNLGPMGIEMFTPLINLPECAILGLGRIQKQVVVEDKQFVARDRMMLSLSFDHRIVDGAPAGAVPAIAQSPARKPQPLALELIEPEENVEDEIKELDSRCAAIYPAR